MKDKFSVNYKGESFHFEVDDNGFVWLLEIQNNNIKTNNGQIKPARNKEEAEQIAKEMLYSMGY